METKSVFNNTKTSTQLNFSESIFLWGFHFWPRFCGILCYLPIFWACFNDINRSQRNVWCRNALFILENNTYLFTFFHYHYRKTRNISILYISSKASSESELITWLCIFVFLHILLNFELVTILLSLVAYVWVLAIIYITKLETYITVKPRI